MILSSAGGNYTGRFCIEKMVNTMLKETAVCLGYPEENFSSHCNRIGCASKLFEAGYTADEISLTRLDV